MELTSTLSLELAQLAARHIAEEGLSYGQAKRKAAKQCAIAEHHAAMPSNDAIEQALQDYLREFQSDTQPQELHFLRSIALEWLTRLPLLNGMDEPCKALAVGAIVNGTANEHSAIHIQVFTDEFKALEMALLNAGMTLEFTEKKLDGAHYPVLVAQDQGVPVALTILPRQRYAQIDAAAIKSPLQTATAQQLQILLHTSLHTP